MAWKVPGKPYKTVIQGRVVTLQGMTIEQRENWNEQFAALKEEDGSFAKVCRLIAEQVQSVSGFDGDIYELLSSQGADMILALQRAIITGSALSEEEVKNFESSSGASTPNAPNTQTPVPGEDALSTEPSLT